MREWHKMPPLELIRKRKFSRGIITHVVRKSSLHGKRVANNNLIVIKIITTYVSSKRNSSNGEQQLGE